MALPLSGVVFGEGREDHEVSDQILDRLRLHCAMHGACRDMGGMQAKVAETGKRHSKGWRGCQRGGAERSIREGRRDC